MPSNRVKYWAFRTAKQFRLNGFAILMASKGSYHVVFDKPVSWTKNVDRSNILDSSMGLYGSKARNGAPLLRPNAQLVLLMPFARRTFPSLVTEAAHMLLSAQNY